MGEDTSMVVAVGGTRSDRRRGRWGAVGALVVGAGLVLGACGGKGSSSTTTTMASTTSTTRASTSTTAASSTTTAAGATTTTVVPTPPPTGMAAWAVGPNDLGATIGKRYTFICPPNGETAYSLWGTGPFTDDSSICVAATYAGLITATTGGAVTFDVQAGSDSYRGGNANGITALDYGPWSQQFVFVK